MSNHLEIILDRDHFFLSYFETMSVAHFRDLMAVMSVFFVYT